MESTVMLAMLCKVKIAMQLDDHRMGARKLKFAKMCKIAKLRQIATNLTTYSDH